jgi:hypothetical protein
MQHAIERDTNEREPNWAIQRNMAKDSEKLLESA